MPPAPDPADIVVLFADLQRGIVEGAQTNSEGHVARGAKALATIAKVLALPALTLGVPLPTPKPHILSEITDVLPDAPLHVRHSVRALHHAETREWLVAQSRRTIWLCGVASEIVIHHAALDALAEGCRLQVLTDATGGLTERGEAATFRAIERAGGEVLSLPTAATAVAGDFTTEQGRAVMAAVMGMR